MTEVLTRRQADIVEDKMERMMKKFFGRQLFGLSGEGFWHPPVDIHLTEISVFVRIDIPGVDPEKVEISIEDNRLTIRGQRLGFQETTKEEKCWYNETQRGDFHRVIELPEYVDSNNTNATYSHGVLTIEMAKKQETKPKIIKVQKKE